MPIVPVSSGKAKGTGEVKKGRGEVGYDCHLFGEKGAEWQLSTTRKRRMLRRFPRPLSTLLLKEEEAASKKPLPESADSQPPLTDVKKGERRRNLLRFPRARLFSQCWQGPQAWRR